MVAAVVQPCGSLGPAVLDDRDLLVSPTRRAREPDGASTWQRLVALPAGGAGWTSRARATLRGRSRSRTRCLVHARRRPRGPPPAEASAEFRRDTPSGANASPARMGRTHRVACAGRLLSEGPASSRDRQSRTDRHPCDQRMPVALERHPPRCAHQTVSSPGAGTERLAPATAAAACPVPPHHVDSRTATRHHASSSGGRRRHHAGPIRASLPQHA